MVWRGACGRESGGRCDGGKRGFGGEMRSVDLGPLIDHGNDLGGAEVGEREVVRWREGEDVALPGYGFGAKEEAGEVCIPVQDTSPSRRGTRFRPSELTSG